MDIEIARLTANGPLPRRGEWHEMNPVEFRCLLTHDGAYSASEDQGPIGR